MYIGWYYGLKQKKSTNCSLNKQTKIGIFLKKRVPCQSRNEARTLKGLEPGLEGCQNHMVFLCPSPMLSIAHLLHFSLCRPLSWLSSPGYYAECVPSSQVCVLQSPPGERFTQSIFVFYSLSVSLSFLSLLPHSPTPTHPYQSPNS